MSDVALFESLLQAALVEEAVPTEQGLLERASRIRSIVDISDEQFDHAVKAIQERMLFKLDYGVALIESHYKPWLHARKAELDQFYWLRYEKYLGLVKKLSPSVVTALDGIADELLDLAGDPTQDGMWARKGLIVGEVQSGKTATYTGLCCKAADAGYKLIILLTGTIESLRRQTQERLDEGFVGRDSQSAFDNKTKGGTIPIKAEVGVGRLDSTRFATVFTSRSSDFSVASARQLGFSISTINEPILLVCKKNAKVLENLRGWLETNNSQAGTGKINAPLLLIDDEADSASINTNREELDPTRTNEQIRKLLALFYRSSYVGVTATPFANVFISPDSVDDMLGDDLFPRDYIYCLEAPTNYRGPEQLFGSEDIAPSIRIIDDLDDSLPINHKREATITRLPPSLYTAVDTFILTNAIRDLRQAKTAHRSMLVNVSRFNSIQEQISPLISEHLAVLRREIFAFSKLPPEQAMQEAPSIKRLREIWDREFSELELKWHDIQPALNAAVQPIVVKPVNQRSGAAALDYHAYSETGLRVIAVGGLSLSRGLTLEGLCVSYFARNSKMYDTLLQMGRWFGYRDSYADLCRVWMTEEAVGWYSHITLATTELRQELNRMRALNLTPADFGLKVRCHPDSLIVTARNKMRSAHDAVHLADMSGRNLETVHLRALENVNEANFKLTARFLEQIPSHHAASSVKYPDWPFWEGVPKDAIIAYLRDFEADPRFVNLQLPAVADYLEESTEPKLQAWDVAVVSIGDSIESVSVAGHTVHPSRRKVTDDFEYGMLRINDSKKRVGSPGHEAVGLSAEEIERANAQHNPKHDQKHTSATGGDYRRERKRPLLLLYFLRANESTSMHWALPLVALSLSFPFFEMGDPTKLARYKVSLVQWRQWFGNDADDDDDLMLEASV